MMGNSDGWILSFLIRALISHHTTGAFKAVPTFHVG